MSAYKLYYMAGACSMAVHVLLQELNQTFTLQNVLTDTGGKSADFLATNPRGQVPTLVTADGTVIREGAAIISWLCDTHPSALWPTSGTDRAAALEWLAFANSTLHPAYSTAMFLKKHNAPAELQTAQHAKIIALWDEVEQRLASHAFICGTQLTPADILLTVIANWQAYISQPVNFGANTKRLFNTVTTRPSYQQALATEQVTYKAAA